MSYFLCLAWEKSACKLVGTTLCTSLDSGVCPTAIRLISACNCVSLQMVAGRGDGLFRHTPPFPQEDCREKGVFPYRCTIAIGTLFMHDCLYIGITCLFSFCFHLLALSHCPLDRGAASIFFPGPGSYHAALSSAEQYFFTLRRKSASLNVCLTPWQLFDRTSTPLFTVQIQWQKTSLSGHLSFASKDLFPAGNRSSCFSSCLSFVPCVIFCEGLISQARIWWDSCPGSHTQIAKVRQQPVRW